MPERIQPAQGIVEDEGQKPSSRKKAGMKKLAGALVLGSVLGGAAEARGHMEFSGTALITLL